MGGLFFCIISIAYMLFGVLFYELRIFTYTDEIVAFGIAAYALWQMFIRQIPVNKPLLIWMGISLFYFIYSFVIESNVPMAIVNDFVMQSKPYLVLFGLLAIKPKLEKWHYDLLQIACILYIFCIIFIYLHHPEDRVVATPGVLLTGEALSAVAILVGTQFYLCGNPNSIVTKIMAVLIMSVGILSPTAKFWGILISAIAILFFVNKPITINLKYLLLGSAAVSLTFFLVKDEFIFYFIDDFEYNTRPMLYIKMWPILADYIPFGTGFATYANPASMIWYSPIYTKYDLDTIWGLDEGNTEHFAADAYYPIVTQFGYVGIVLLIWFFVYIFKRMNRLYELTHDIKRYRVTLIIMAYFIIEATSNAIANERCVIAMGLLAISLYYYSGRKPMSAINSFGLDFANNSFTPNDHTKDESTVNK